MWQVLWVPHPVPQHPPLLSCAAAPSSVLSPRLGAKVNLDRISVRRHGPSCRPPASGSSVAWLRDMFCTKAAHRNFWDEGNAVHWCCPTW